MHFVEVKPGTVDVKPRGNLKMELKEFVSMNIELAKCLFEKGRYTNSQVACRTINASAKRYCYSVRAFEREGEVYLKRTDM